jgi:hypothetical protein
LTLRYFTIRIRIGGSIGAKFCRTPLPMVSAPELNA